MKIKNKHKYGLLFYIHHEKEVTSRHSKTFWKKFICLLMIVVFFLSVFVILQDMRGFWFWKIPIIRKNYIGP